MPYAAYMDRLIAQLDRLIGRSAVLEHVSPRRQWRWPLLQGNSFILREKDSDGRFYTFVASYEASHESCHRYDTDGLRCAMTTLLLWYGLLSWYGGDRRAAIPQAVSAREFFRIAASGQGKAVRKALTKALDQSRVEDMVQSLKDLKVAHALEAVELDDIDPELLF